MAAKLLPGLCIALALSLYYLVQEQESRLRKTRLSDSEHYDIRINQRCLLDTSRPAPLPAATALFSTNAGDDADNATVASQPPSAILREIAAVEPDRAADNNTPKANLSTGSEPYPLPHRYGLTAGTALASLNVSGTPALPATANTSFAYPTLPPKGIAIRGSGLVYKERKDGANTFGNSYTHDGRIYSLGAAYDWSVDSTIGLSADFLTAETTGTYPDELRRTETTGYFVSAHYSGDFAGKVPFKTKAMYGWLDQSTSGSINDWYLFTPSYPWKEDNHASRLFGFSASVIYPLLGPGSIRITPEAGLDYRNLRTGAFTVDIGDIQPLLLSYPAMNSTSFTSSMVTTIAKDFQQVWGVVTPSLSFGYSREFSDSAGGVRALGASAAYPVYVDSLAMTASPAAFDLGPKSLWMVKAGLDMRVLGGWDIRADYEKRLGDGYDKDAFRLEISRCF